jgi:predicted trehalose synthase
LIEKALEGSAKGASTDAIATAVRSLAAALAGARESLGIPSTPDELNAGAVALRLGARREDLTRLRAARGRGSLVVPLGVLSDLMARGVPTDTAARVVVALAAQADDEYIAFRQRVDRDIDLGAAPVGSVIGALNSSGRAALQSPGKKP